MFRRAPAVLAKQTERVIVRDPRIAKQPKAPTTATPTSGGVVAAPSPSAVDTKSNLASPAIHQQPLPSATQQRQPLPFEPTLQNQQSIGSTIGSYVLAGFGMGLGVILVRVVLGF